MMKTKKIFRYLAGLDLVKLRKNYLQHVRDNLLERLDFVSSFGLRYGPLFIESEAIMMIAHGQYKNAILYLTAAEGSRLVEYLDAKEKKKRVSEGLKIKLE